MVALWYTVNSVEVTPEPDFYVTTSRNITMCPSVWLFEPTDQSWTISVICVHSGMVVLYFAYCKWKVPKSSINIIQKCVCCVVLSYLWAIKQCRVITSPPDGSVLKAKINDPNHSLDCTTESSSDQVEGNEQKYYNNASPVSDVSQSKVSVWAAGANDSRRACVHVGVQEGVWTLYKPLDLHRLHRHVVPATETDSAHSCTR